MNSSRSPCGGGAFRAEGGPSPRAQVLDRYFGNVCELDLIFNFHKAYHILGPPHPAPPASCCQHRTLHVVERPPYFLLPSLRPTLYSPLRTSYFLLHAVRVW